MGIDFKIVLPALIELKENNWHELSLRLEFVFQLYGLCTVVKDPILIDAANRRANRRSQKIDLVCCL